MGQRTSKIERKAKAIAKVVRNTKPTPALHSSVPINATLSRNRRWDSIFRAEARDRLEETVYEFLRHHDMHALLAFVATEHNEKPAETSSRFVLRYLDEADFNKMTRKQKSALVANMLQDELDLSGFRLGTALKRWRWIVQQTNKMDRLDDQEMTLARNSIFAFLHDHGLRSLVDCLQEEHADEPGVRKALSTILDTNERTGESILYEVDPKLIARSNRAIATNVRDWLLGSELSFPEPKFTASKDPWAGLAGEALPKNQQKSMDSIVDAIKAVPICWNIAYQRALRHAEFYSLEDMIEALFEGIKEPRLSLWLELSAEDMMRYGRRRQPAERVIAFIIDNIVFGERDSRRLIVYDTSNTLMVRRIKTSKTQGSKSDSTRPAPITVPPPEGQKQRSGADQHDRDRSKRTSPAAKDLATVEALYHDLLQESESLRLENVELDETISYLLDEITTLQDRVDMEENDDQGKERDCPICGHFLIDEQSEHTHMKLHRDEINKCRKKNKRSRLPGSRSPSGVRKRRSKSSSQSSSPSSKDGDSPKDHRKKGLSPRRGSRSLPAPKTRSRGSPSKSPSPSSKGLNRKDDGTGIGQPTQRPDGQFTQQGTATGNTARPFDAPDALGISIPRFTAPLEPNDALSGPPIMPGSRRPLVSPAPPNRKAGSQSPRSRANGSAGRRPTSRSPNRASNAGTRSPAKPKPQLKAKDRGRASSRASSQASRPRSLSNTSSQPYSPRRTRSQTKASREGSQSRSPSVEPKKVKKGRALQSVVVVPPPIPEDDEEGDGNDIVVGRVEVPEVPLDPAELLTWAKKRSVGQAFVEFMRDHRESPEDARKRGKR